MFFVNTNDGLWVPCGPKQPGAVQITMQELAAKGLASKVMKRAFSSFPDTQEIYSNFRPIDNSPIHTTHNIRYKIRLYCFVLFCSVLYCFVLSDVRSYCRLVRRQSYGRILIRFW